MDLKIREIKDSTDHDKERLVIDVEADTNLSYFVVADTTYDENGVSNEWRHCYFFREQFIIKGDIVVLYTRRATPTSKHKISIRNGKNTQYNYYWGLDGSVWNNEEDIAYLIEIKEVRKTKLS